MQNKTLEIKNKFSLNLIVINKKDKENIYI